MLRTAPDSACRHHNNHMSVEHLLCARFLVSHPYRRNLHSPHDDVQLYFFLNSFGLIYGSRLGQALGRVFFCPVLSGCAAVQPLCEIQGLRGHAACSIFLAALEGSCRDRSNAEADRYRCVILTATGRFVTYLAFCITIKERMRFYFFAFAL